MIEIIKAIFFGIVEGITEWLPISSTGHMIILDEFVKLNVRRILESVSGCDPAGGDPGGCSFVLESDFSVKPEG